VIKARLQLAGSQQPYKALVLVLSAPAANPIPCS